MNGARFASPNRSSDELAFDRATIIRPKFPQLAPSPPLDVPLPQRRIVNRSPVLPLEPRLADTPRESDAICRLLAAGFSELSRSAACEKVESQYISNPSGIACCVVMDGEQPGELVGMQALVSRTFVAGDVDLKPCSIADFVVLPEHRSLGPALRLLKHSIQQGRQHFDFLFGFPNDVAARIFAHAGLKPIGRVVRYVRLLRSSRLLSSRTARLPRPLASMLLAAVDGWLWLKRIHGHDNSLAWSAPNEFGNILDELWTLSDRSDLVLGVRSREQLAWRFKSNQDARIALCRRRDGDAVIGYVIWVRGKHAIRILDLFCVRPTQDIGTLLAGFIRHVDVDGADSVSMEFTGPRSLQEAIVAVGFRPRESTPYLGVIGDRGLISEQQLAALYLTSFDRDSD